MAVKNLTIEDEWGGRFDPHLGVDQVGSACLLGAALTSHHLGYMGRLIGPRGKAHHLERERSRHTDTISIRDSSQRMASYYYFLLTPRCASYPNYAHSPTTDNQRAVICL